MNYKLHNLVAATLTGTLLMGFGVNAMADSTFDLVQALVAKGVLTEEEAIPLMKGRENDIALADKKVKKVTKLGISDAIDNATVYGDIRVRYEDRSGTGIGVFTPTAPAPAVAVPGADQTRDRARYKITLGVKTESGDFYTDLALAMGANGRSDNATFGKSALANIDDKEGLFVKRALIGWKATDWLTLEAGRMNNPLYTTPMVWDADLNFEGLAEMVKYKVGDADLFFTAAQAEYQGDRKSFNGTPLVAPTTTTELFAFQGGGKYTFNENTSAKAALTFTTYTHNTGKAAFQSGLSNTIPTTLAGYGYGVNDLDTIEIPAEVNWMVSSNIGVRAFGDYVYNTSGSDRYNAAVAASNASAAVSAAGNDDTAWMLGLAIGSAKDLKAFESNKMAKGDWSARIWYQDVGAYAVDPNAVDSDFMDSRVNMKGMTFKAQYNIQDNVFANFAYGHATRKNGALGTGGTGQDLALNLDSFDLLQFDLTYKF